MALIAESFTGSNGSSPGGTVTANGGAVNIQSNKLRITTAADDYVTSRWARTGLANGDLLLDLTVATVAEHYIDVMVRSSSTNSFANGYSLQLAPSFNTVTIAEWASGADSELDSASFSFTAATTYRLRFRFNGSSLQARIWEWGDPEPDTWLVEATDATVTSAGSIQLAVTSGALATARTVNYDTLFVDDLSITPGTGTKAATTQSWGSPVHSETFTDPAVIDDDTATPYYFLVFEGAGYQGRGTQSRGQVSVHDGVLTLYGDEAGNTAALGVYPAQQYGRYELRMRVPYGDWFYHPVLLTWPESEVWPDDGEIDFAEMEGGTSTGTGTVDVQFNLHYGAENSQVQDLVEDVDIRAWHNYALDWSPDGIRGYLDGTLFFESTAAGAPEAMPPGPMWLGIQLDNYDDNVPAEMTRPAAMQIAQLDIYEVEASEPQTVTATGLASTEAFGTAVIHTTVGLTVTSIATEEAFGTAELTIGPASLRPTSIVSVEAFGTVVVGRGPVDLTPTAIDSAEAFGTAAFRQRVAPSGIVSAASVGSPVVDSGAPPTAPTAAVVHHWGLPLAQDTFDYLGVPDEDQWELYDGPGHDGNGVRTPDNIILNGQFLRLLGEKNGDAAGMAHTLNQVYGRWEVRARVTRKAGDSGNPYHPVLITWPQSDEWPQGGEYDFFEVDAGDTRATAFMHWPADEVIQQEFNSDPMDLGEWHHYGFEWTEDHLAGYIDGEEWFFYDEPDAITHEPMHLTMQIDDFFPEANLHEAYFDIEWARVYDLSGEDAFPQTVSPNGMVTREAFGNPIVDLSLKLILPPGIPAGSVGTPAVSGGGQDVTDLVGISSAEAFGLVNLANYGGQLVDLGPAVNPQYPSLTLYPGTDVYPGVGGVGGSFGIGSVEAFGTGSLAIHPAGRQISAVAIGSAEAFGTALVFFPPVFADPTGIASEESFGNPEFDVPPHDPGIPILVFGGIHSGEAFGTPRIPVAHFGLVQPVRVEQYRLGEPFHVIYITNTVGLTVLGDDTGLIVIETPSTEQVESAKYVWQGGHDNITDDPAIRNLWLANGLQVRTVYDGV